MAEFHKVATTDQVPEGHGIAVESEGLRIAIFNVNGEFRAIEAACARHEAPLERGVVDDDTLFCPYHNATFDLESGECSQFPGEASGRVFLTRVDGGDILVAY